jgi:hypothetical protein
MKPLTDYVCNKEQSKELKELGVKQDSLFYWQENNVRGKYDPFLHNEIEYEQNGIGCHDCGGIKCPTCEDAVKHEYPKYSAFTSGELGVMLPFRIKNKHDKNCYLLEDKAVIEREIQEDEIEEFFISYESVPEFHNPNEAIARADLLIYLLKGGLIKVEDVNKRLGE